MRNLDWRLRIVGALDRDPVAVASLKTAIDAAGLDDRISLAGTVVPATLDRFYESADIFVMPSLFEGYGMVLAEAMSRGLPIVCTTGGAAGETVPDGAAIKVPPVTSRRSRTRSPRFCAAASSAPGSQTCPGTRTQAADLERDGAARRRRAPGPRGMSAFAPEWLALREPADARARNAEVADALAARLGARASLAVVDLGCGTGANLRATAPLLGERQRWTLADNDPALLTAARDALARWADAARNEGENLVLVKGDGKLRCGFAGSTSPQISKPRSAGTSISSRRRPLRSGVGCVHQAPRGRRQAGAQSSTALTYNGVQRWRPRHPPTAP